MTGSRYCRLSGFVGQIVNQPTFRDVCTKSGKWFHAAGELFRRGLRDETIRYQKCQQFELDDFG
jgi:hypothetical protein